MASLHFPSSWSYTSCATWIWKSHSRACNLSQIFAPSGKYGAEREGMGWRTEPSPCSPAPQLPERRDPHSLKPLWAGDTAFSKGCAGALPPPDPPWACYRQPFTESHTGLRYFPSSAEEKFPKEGHAPLSDKWVGTPHCGPVSFLGGFLGKPQGGDRSPILLCKTHSPRSTWCSWEEASGSRWSSPGQSAAFASEQSLTESLPQRSASHSQVSLGWQGGKRAAVIPSHRQPQLTHLRSFIPSHVLLCSHIHSFHQCTLSTFHVRDSLSPHLMAALVTPVLWELVTVSSIPMW